MKSKVKLGLGALASVATVGAVMPLATACSKTSNIIRHVHESADDIKYGLNANTYKQLKKDYESKLTNSMISQGIQKGSSLWNSKMSNMQLAFNEFDNKANTTSMSYATLTSSLMKYASTIDNIQLRRVTNTKWSDINAMFQGAYDSFELYMTHEHFSEARKTQILNEAVDKFNLKITQLENEGYKENDPFGALQEVRMDLINYFDEINDRIAYISTHMRLNDFYSKYAIRYRTLEDSSAYKNVWSEITKYVNKQIPTDLFNRLFYVVDVETGNKIKFEPTLLVPGYTFIPKLVSCSADEKTNVFKVDIDMGLIKSSFLNTNDEERIKKLTVHSVEMDENFGIVDKTGEIQKALIENKDVSNDSDFFEMTSKLPIKTDSYNLWNQINEENSSIKDTYFNKNKDKYIRFRWPDSTSEHAKIDPFINKISLDSEKLTSYVSLAELGQAGLEMSQDGKTWYTVPEVMVSLVNKKSLNAMNCLNGTKLENTLMEDFVENCDVLSEVKYVERQSGSYEITNKFYVTFKNSENPVLLNNIYRLEDDFITGKCENYKISPFEYVEASTKFSKIKNLVEEYTEKGQAVNKIHKSICGWIAGLSVGVGVIGTLMIALTARMVYAKANFAEGVLFNDVAALVTGAGAIAAGSVAINRLRKMKSRTSDYLDRLDQVKKDDSVIRLLNKINTFSDLFVYVDEQGNYDKEQAKIKGAKFSSLKFKEQWESVSYFNSIFEPNHDGYNFKQLIEKNNVGEDAVNELQEMFSNKNPDFEDLIGRSVTVGAALIELAIALATSAKTSQNPEEKGMIDDVNNIKNHKNNYGGPDPFPTKNQPVYEDVLDVDEVFADMQDTEWKFMENFDNNYKTSYGEIAGDYDLRNFEETMKNARDSLKEEIGERMVCLHEWNESSEVVEWGKKAADMLYEQRQPIDELLIKADAISNRVYDWAYVSAVNPTLTKTVSIDYAEALRQSWNACVGEIAEKLGKLNDPSFTNIIIKVLPK